SLYSKIEEDTMRRIADEAHARCCKSYGNDRGQIEAALEDGYGNRFAPFKRQVVEEEQKKKEDIASSISKNVNEEYQKSRESELLVLIRDDDGMIEKLSRYQASLMNAANRAVQQLRLLKAMKGASNVIAFE